MRQIKIQTNATAETLFADGDAYQGRDPEKSVARYMEMVAEAVRREYPDYDVEVDQNLVDRIYIDTDDDENADEHEMQSYIRNDIMHGVFVSFEWVVEAPELNAVMTAGEIEDTYGLGTGTVRQAINRRQIIARKSGDIWLVRRTDAETKWGSSTTMYQSVIANGIILVSQWDEDKGDYAGESEAVKVDGKALVLRDRATRDEWKAPLHEIKRSIASYDTPWDQVIEALK